MYVNIIFLEKFRLNFIVRSNGTNVSNTCLCRLFHNISQLSGKHQLTLAGHYIDFNLQCIATHLCPGKPAGNTNLIFLICHKIVKMLFSKKIGQIL